MRLLLATDGSAGAQTATDRVTGLPWPSGTTVDVVRVVDTMSSAWAYAPVPDLHVPQEQLMAEARQGVDEMVIHLRNHGLGATGFLVQGPETAALLDHATTNATDLIVCGSRGRGYLRSLLLGSVSAGLAARAHCSVLVARHPTATKVVVAVDGSPSATAAEHIVMGLPMFDQLPFDLLTVTGPAVGPEEEWEAHVRLVGQVQHSVAERLRERGRIPREVVLTGRPASEIVDHVTTSGASLVVLGAHDQTGLDKLLLGSTTLEVLTHSSASVLVAREPVTRRDDRGRAIRVPSRDAHALVGANPPA